jgi:predicted 3-demethylubiquinone-9 3-methyltransferase (glyoxalase superfamily)
MFAGQEEEPLTFHVDLIPDSQILNIELYGADAPGAEGSVMTDRFSCIGLA